MSGFGKEVEVSGGAVRKLYVGAENFKVVGINPTKAELEVMYGREINFDPEYVGRHARNQSQWRSTLLVRIWRCCI